MLVNHGRSFVADAGARPRLWRTAVHFKPQIEVTLKTRIFESYIQNLKVTVEPNGWSLLLGTSLWMSRYLSLQVLLSRCSEPHPYRIQQPDQNRHQNFFAITIWSRSGIWRKKSRTVGATGRHFPISHFIGAITVVPALNQRLIMNLWGSVCGFLKTLR